MRYFIISLALFIQLSAFSQVYYGADAQQRVAGAAVLKMSAQNEVPEYIRFAPGKELAEAQLSSFLQKQFKLPESFSFVSLSTIQDQRGDLHKRYRLSYDDAQLHEGMFITHVRQGKIYAINGQFPQAFTVQNSLALSENEALQAALKHINAITYKWELKEEEAFIKQHEDNPNATFFPQGRKMIKWDKKKQAYRYVWVFDIYAHKPLSRADYFVDAQSAEILFVNNKIHHQDTIGTAVTKFSSTQSITTDLHNSNFRLRESGRGNGIETYNMQTGTSYGSAVDFIDSDNYWNNVNAQKDEVATDAHWGMEMTYDYYWNRYNRNSIDGNGFKLKSYVHYDMNYANAFWNGQFMTFGDGNSSWQPLVALDIVGHEITHGLTTFSANLDYQDESGAMNEAYSDIFGSAIEHYGKPASANWTIGEDIGNAMRDMSNPKSKGDPDTYMGQNYYVGAADNGGVHTNNGVLNHWFYLTSVGGQGVNDNNDSYNVTGVGIDTAGAIAFRTLTVYLINTSQHSDCRFYSIQSAMDLYGPCSAPVEATTRAFYAVGVGPDYVPGVHADFDALMTTYCQPPASVTFENLSSNANAFYWDFGDGDTSSAINPTHVYTHFGNYTVKLIASGGSCGMDSVLKTEYVSVDTANPCLYAIPPNGNLMLSSCDGIITDDGGTGNYSNNSNASITIAPLGASKIKLTFTSFDFEDGYDYLKIYDGSSASAPIIGSYAGSNLPNGGVITSTTGAITIVQTSDQAVTQGGFVANYECIMPTTPPTPDFEVDDSLSCTGTVYFADNSKNGPLSWHWDFGDGTTSNLQNPMHSYFYNGLYNVKLVVTNGIGADSIVKNGYVRIEKLFAPNAPSKALCNGGSVDLVAYPTHPMVKVNWYDSQAATTPIHTGDTLSLSNLAQTETYYAELELDKAPLSVGKPTNAGGGGNLTYTHGLYFDAYQSFILHSVNVYANSAGNRTITLKRSNGMTLGTKTVQVNSGLNTVILDFTVPIGTDLLLEGEDLYRNNSGTNYPYILPNYLSINRSTAGTDPTGYYYYFYDWKIKRPSCVGDRIAVNAFVNSSAPVADFSFINNDPYVDFTDQTQNQGAVTWDFGDGGVSSVNNPTHLFLQNGTYQVSMQVDNGCGTDQVSKTVSIQAATSIDEIEEEQHFKLYPNPADEKLFISFESPVQLQSIQLFDLTGRKVTQFNVQGSQSVYQLSLNGLSSGVYLVQIQLDSKLLTRKLVVE